MNRHVIRPTAGVTCVIACAFLAGCGGDGQVSVRGTVKFDGKPVSNGVIHFNPADPRARNAGSLIKDGSYEIPVAAGPVAGTYSAIIYWPQPTGKKIPNPDLYGEQKMIDEARELLPAKFNSQTTLTAEFKPGENVVDFDLSSK